MNVQLIKNAVLMGGTLILWLALIAIEVFTGYSGIFLQAIYALSLFTLFVALWLVNRPVVAVIMNEILQFISCGVLALGLTGLFVFVAVVVGVNFKNMIGSTW